MELGRVGQDVGLELNGLLELPISDASSSHINSGQAMSDGQLRKVTPKRLHKTRAEHGFIKSTHTQFHGQGAQIMPLVLGTKNDRFTTKDPKAYIMVHNY